MTPSSRAASTSRSVSAGRTAPGRYLLLSSRGARFLKRSLDLAVCLLLAIPVFLLVPVIALVIKLDSRGPILFRQDRVGRGGHPFTIYKFRSMHVDAEARLFSDPDLESAYLANGFKIPVDEDPRITRVGRFLRRTSLDELPQFWNALVGNMSVIGPRPILPDEVPAVYRGDTKVCLLVKPGITGLWQVSGRSEIVGRERADLDYSYVEHWTFGEDVRILVRTVPAVFAARGAF